MKEVFLSIDHDDRSRDRLVQYLQEMHTDTPNLPNDVTQFIFTLMTSLNNHSSHRKISHSLATRILDHLNSINQYAKRMTWKQERIR